MKSQDSDIICRNCGEAVSDDEMDQRRKIAKKAEKNELASSIIQLYENLLHRFPDKEGFDYFYSRLYNKEITIQGLEAAIKQSFEYAHDRRVKIY